MRALARSDTPSPEADRNLVVLPAFEVQGTRPWLYAELPGYQFLSLASESETRAMLQRFQQASQFTPLFFPPGYNTQFAAPSTVFLHHFAGGRTVDEAARRLQLAYKPSGFTVSAGDTFVEFPTPERISEWLKGGQIPSPFFSLSQLVTPRIPVWYREGLNVLLSAARVSERSLQTNALNWNGTAVMPLRQVLTISTDNEFAALNATRPGELESYRMGAVLFAHWAFFGDKGVRRPALLRLVEAMSQRPTDVGAFERCFGLSIANAEHALADYARSQAWRPVRLDLPPDLIASTRSASITISPASEAEVARIVGESYILLASTADGEVAEHYRQRARNVLAPAYHLGSRDPRLVAQMGLLEYAEQHPEPARSHLEFSTERGVPLPRAYTTLALLRLASSGAQLGDDHALTEQQGRDVLTPAIAALSLQPRLADAYTIAIDIFKRGAVHPTAEQMTLLETAAGNFPAAIPLLANLTLVEVREERYDAARTLVDHILATPEISPTVRTAFENLRTKLALPPK